MLKSSLFFLFSLFTTAAIACDATEMATNEDGFIRKIVASSDQIQAYKTNSAVEEAFKLELLQPYFVVCEADDLLKITDQPTDSVEEANAGTIGFVKRDQVADWNTREALSFSEIAFLEERPEIVAWYDEGVLDKFMESGNLKLNPPAFKENLESTLKRERTTRPYPVLNSQVKKYRSKTDKRVFEVLLPVAVTPTDTIVVEKSDEKKLEKTLTSATLLLVFDATGSMGSVARTVARSINDALSTVPQSVRDGTEMGFVFYRDADDAENLVEVPPLKLKEAAATLNEAAGLMSGGGDVAEPILDALYYGANIYKWGQAGSRIMIGVLNGDAKIATSGDLDKKGRVPVGIDSIGMVKNLVENRLKIITVQAGKDAGPNLVPVLTTLAEETGGQFIEWGAGDQVKDISTALTLAMSRAAKAKIEEGTELLTKKAYDLRGYPTIPLEVLDGEVLERLRAAGVRFNINRAEGGVLVEQGYMLENPDLLDPQIQVEKDTLQNLVNLYNVLGTVGLDTESMQESVSNAIAAIAGEDYDPKEPIQEILRKRLGIQFRSELLNFDLAYLDTLLPAERNKFAKRIQEAGNSLGQYLEANLEKFDTNPAVWMPLAVLP